jgi:hypothetical protein
MKTKSNKINNQAKFIISGGAGSSLRIVSSNESFFYYFCMQESTKANHSRI